MENKRQFFPNVVNGDSVFIAVTAVVMFGAAILLQVHSIQFWNENVSPTTGWAFSILLEGSALWLWWQRNRCKRLLGAIASILVLAGPLYTLSVPVMKSSHNIQVTEAAAVRTIEELEQQIASIEETKQQYLHNSSERTGWLIPIETATSEIATLRAELRDLIASSSKREPLWMKHWIVIMQLITLMLLQVVSVLAVTSLSKMIQGITDRAANSHLVETDVVERASRDGVVQVLDRHTIASRASGTRKIG